MSEKERELPWVLNCLSTGVSLSGIKFHEVTDEVFCRLRDIIPVGGIELIVSSHDLLEQLSVVLMIEWRVATESEEGGREGGRGEREGKRRREGGREGEEKRKREGGREGGEMENSKQW